MMLSSSASSRFFSFSSQFFSSFKSVERAKAAISSIIKRLLSYSITATFIAAVAMKWKPTSPEELAESEKKLLSYMKKPPQGYFVDIGSGWGLENNKVWTIETDGSSKKMPLVLLHGFGCGASIWCLNLDSLSDHRKVYAIDVLGFARSSRPAFSRNEMAEYEIVESIERWRKAVGLDQKFILLGHSFGGYLSLAYALRFPDHVAHVVLADPWGLPSHQTASASVNAQLVLPWWVKVVARVLFQAFNPLAALRAAGPLGPSLVHKLRPDIRKKFEPLIGEKESGIVLDYVYHCNAQSNPTGEIAFKTLSHPTGWAKNPMIYRVGEMSPDIDLSFIYGGRSWIDRQPGIQIKHQLSDRSVEVHVIHGAGHHVYADKLEEFNQLVIKACRDAEERHRTRVAQQITECLHDQD